MSSNQCLHENTLFSLETKTLRDLYKNNEELSTLWQGNLNLHTLIITPGEISPLQQKRTKKSFESFAGKLECFRQRFGGKSILALVFAAVASGLQESMEVLGEQTSRDVENR